MAKNTMTDLRNHLFEMLENLKDVESAELPNEVFRARAICDLSRQLIESAKVEIDYISEIGGQTSASQFLEVKQQPQLTNGGANPALEEGRRLPAGAVEGRPVKQAA
jgi:hypothetical protein